MKKIAVIFLSAAMSFISLTGCTNSMKEVSYEIEQKNPENGWREFVKLKVKNGKITEVVFDGINNEGMLKTEDQSYRETMEKVDDTYPEKFYSELEKQLIEKQDTDKIDVVTGATASSENFKILVKELIDKGVEKGITEKIIYDNKNQ